MVSPLPFRPSIDHTPKDRSVIDLTDEESSTVIKALRSDTAREIYTTLAVEPTTASDLADRTDTSLQNVQYHLEQLADADLITAAGTWYSEKGNEMTVYAPTSNHLKFTLTPDDSPSSPDSDRKGLAAKQVLHGD